MTDTQRLELFLFVLSALDFILIVMMLKALRDQNLMIHNLGRRIRDLTKPMTEGDDKEGTPWPYRPDHRIGEA